MGPENNGCSREELIAPRSQTINDLKLQLVLSLVLGISAFITFCVGEWSLMRNMCAKVGDTNGLPA